MMPTFLFYIFATLTIFSSLMVITRKNPIASAIYLIMTLFLIASLYAGLSADFVAVIQVLVYAGAIMVLFLFVIMLLNLEPHQLKAPKPTPAEYAVMLVSLVAFTSLSLYLCRHGFTAPQAAMSVDEHFVHPPSNSFLVGLKLFQHYVWPFELASILILLAIVASIVIARKPKESTKTLKES